MEVEWIRVLANVETVEAIIFFGGMEYLPRNQIARPAASMSQALRFREVCSFPTQLLCQQLLLGDVNCRSVKRLENSTFKNRNAHAANVPHLPVWSNNPYGYVTATTLFMHRPDGFLHRSTVIRVDSSQILLKVRRPVLWVK